MKGAINLPISQDILRYQPVMGRWTKFVIPNKFSVRLTYYDYDVRIPTKAMSDWLNDCCEYSYRLNIYGSSLVVYFEHEMMALQFKLAFGYE